VTLQDEVAHGDGEERVEVGPLTQQRESAGCTTDDLRRLADRGLRFGTVYADPPWPYQNQATRGATGRHYPAMSIDEMAALPIAELAADASHLHLWTTNAFLFESHRLIGAWGFQYKSCFVWNKPQMGIGNYWRVSHELMLLGVRGSCPFRSHRQRSWLTADRREHSRKPEEVRALIETVSPGPYLELFGRRVVAGWTVWGNEISRALFDSRLEDVDGSARQAPFHWEVSE